MITDLLFIENDRLTLWIYEESGKFYKRVFDTVLLKELEFKEITL